MLAALTTLVQSWYVRGGAAGSVNPYRLYAASNLGSLVGLFSYPLFFESQFSLAGQRSAFLLLLVLLIIPVALLGLGSSTGLRWRKVATSDTIPAGVVMGAGEPAGGVGQFSTRSWWTVIALSAIPSSLLLSVTGYVLTDIASMPLCWVVPSAASTVACGSRWMQNTGNIC